MNEIVNLKIENLKHHPENPRRDLGDLTELTESIRKNGIMQNLTVVFDDLQGSGKYLVVIGNRRMEAAKLAGLDMLPCVISEMDRRTQIATMLEENMQRSDLTVYEQAQGFQMMMDLGFKPEEISEKTGFSETTVRRRLKMAELDKKTFEKACAKQITIEDLDRLSQLDSIKERNALLKEYGENNFEWKLNRAVKVQKSVKVKTKAHKMLQDANVKKVPDKDKYALYGGGYEKLYDKTCELDKWDGISDFIPKKDGELFYTEDETDICFYIKKKKQKAEPVKKSQEELEKARKRDLAWKAVDRCAEASAELRKQYVDGMTVSPKNAMRMLQHAMAAAFGCMINYTTPTIGIKEALESKSHVIPEIIAEVTNNLMDLPQKKWPGLILLMFESDWKERKAKPPMFAEGSRSYEFPKYKRNVMMELCYTWLMEFGYQMSTEEEDMLAGTHPVFKGVIE